MTQEIGTNDLRDTWAANGAKVEPPLLKKDSGWLADERPAHQYMNSIQNALGKQINYLMRSGIPSWNIATPYEIGDVVISGGIMYIAILATTGDTPATPSTFWSETSIQNKFDAIVAPAVTNDETEGYTVSSVWFDTLQKKIWHCTDATTGAAVWVASVVKNNFVAIVVPAVTNDETEGYVAGSFWYDTVTTGVFICSDATTGAAVWISLKTIVADASTTVKGVVELATDAEVATATDTTRAITPSNITSIFKKTAETSLGAGTTITIAHSLGRQPIAPMMYFKCVTADSGYSVGDVVSVLTYYDAPGSSGGSGGCLLSISTGNFTITFEGNSFFKMINKSTRNIVHATFANWRIYVEYI